jgi:uncharacterized protein
LVVKLIDVYLDEVAGQLNVGGYQITGTVPKPIEANESLSYRFALPTTNHVFLPGHRIMVQVQSSWFPLYDRNPRTFVPTIFWAKPEDYQKATQRIYHSPEHRSALSCQLRQSSKPGSIQRGRRVSNCAAPINLPASLFEHQRSA